MPDRPNMNHQTGSIPAYEGEPNLKRESHRPTSLPEVPKPPLMESTTGHMPVVSEPDDDTAERDGDAPVT